MMMFPKAILRRPPGLQIVLLALMGLGGAAFAAEPAGVGASLELGAMSMGLLGGLALFLFGMEQMTDALKAAAGEQMKNILARLTTNRFTGALTGALVTAIIQSSSVTTVLVVGFASAGLMTLNQSIGVIMGANIGTTVTAQIVAFKVVKLALLFIAAGFALLFLSHRDRIRRYGGIIMGLGLVFYGMNVMSEAMAPLRSYQPFLDFMVTMERPILGILVGSLFTALIQSSSATTGIVIVMASQGFITLQVGIALALGANIGTCVTAVLAAIGKPRIALRAAGIHVIFNVLGVLFWFGFIDQLAHLAVQVSPMNPELDGMARLAAETPRQIANANTLFNVANTLIFIGFTAPLGWLAGRMFPDRPSREQRPIVRPRYLEERLIETPAIALDMARREIGHLGEHIQRMLAETRVALQTRNLGLFLDIQKMDDAADILHAAIIEYLSKIGKQSLTEAENEEFYRLTHAADNLESIGDLIETDLVSIGDRLITRKLEPSTTMNLLLITLHEGVLRALEGAVKAVAENDQAAAQEVLAMKDEVNRRINMAFKRQTQSLAVSAPTRLETLRVEFELIDKLKQIYNQTKRIAHLYLPR